jgi:hypothetical protein
MRETDTVMRKIIKTGTAALLLTLVTANQSFAWCLFGGIGTTCGGDGGSGPTAAPEFDGPGAIAAIALLVSVVAILYQRARK